MMVRLDWWPLTRQKGLEVSRKPSRPRGNSVCKGPEVVERSTVRGVLEEAGRQARATAGRALQATLRGLE